MNDIIDNIINNTIDSYKIYENIKYQISSSFNQKNKIYENISSINLHQCEEKLKSDYGIPPNSTLIIFKYDYISYKTLVPIVGYEVFSPVTKEKLDLNKCQNIKIDLFLPSNISNKEIYKHDPNDNYYKDRCNSFPNEKGVDMTVYDRKKEYNDKNYALCYENCDFINYNNETKKVLCQCEPQYNSSLITLDKIINGKKLLNNLLDIKKSINLIIIKCFKKFMSSTGFKNNIGSYMILSIIAINLGGLILFLTNGYNLLTKKIDNIIINFKEKNKPKNIIIISNPPIKKNMILNTDTKSEKQKVRIDFNLTNSNINNSSFSKFNIKKNKKLK